MINRSFTLILVIAIMLPLFWITTDTRAQSVCPGVEHPIGWFRMNVTYPDDTFVGSQFTAGLYGSLESVSSGVIGDLDWLYNDGSFVFESGDQEVSGINTTFEAETQTVNWWSQKNSRNTHIQFTNNMPAGIQSSQIGVDVTDTPIPLGVHVQIFGEECQELINFCDFYTPQDTHVYNLGDLTTNAGQIVSTASLQGREGFMTLTAVANCGTDDRAIEVSNLVSTVRIIDTANEVDYGVNAWHRDAEVSECGTFEDDEFACEVNGSEITVCGASILSGEGIEGDPNSSCAIRPLEPSQLSQHFSTIGEGPAADVVLFSFGDVYNFDNPAIGYQAAPATATYIPDMFDDQENLVSCPAIETCFARIGVNDALPISEDFVAPTPEPTPTPDPTPTPEPTPTPTPDPGDTTGGDGGDGGGCTVAATATAATAAANFLLPLLPLAGAYGIRRIRKYNRKTD